jgi:hypothetical protein
MTSEQQTAAVGPLAHDIGSHGRVVIGVEADDVRVRGVDGTVVRVVAPSDGAGLETTAEAGRFIVRSDTRRRGAFLGIRIGGFGVGARLGGTLELEVPRDARVEVRSAAGDIAVRDILGGATVRTVSGDVSVKRTGGPLDIGVASGDVLVEASDPISLEARSVSGDIRVRAPVLERVAVETVSGNVALTGALAAGEHVTTTVSGEAELAVGDDLALSFRTVSGAISCNHPRFRGGDGRRQPLVIGDGTARFAVRTMSGDVRVRAAPPATPPATPADRRPSSASGPADASSTPPPGAAHGVDLAVLEALSRGEIDVGVAERRMAAAAPASAAGAGGRTDA